MKGTMNALITKMKMGEHEHDEAVTDQLLVRPHFFSLADMNVNI